MSESRSSLLVIFIVTDVNIPLFVVTTVSNTREESVVNQHN